MVLDTEFGAVLTWGSGPGWSPVNQGELRSWPLLLLAIPAAVTIWSGWVGIGEMTGFGLVHPLTGIWNSCRINTAVTLPVDVEAYAAHALRAWLTGWIAPGRPAITGL